MISDKRLKKWRMEALLNREAPEATYNNVKEMAERILEMSQELMDIRLLKKKLPREDQRVVASDILRGDKKAGHALHYDKEKETEDAQR